MVYFFYKTSQADIKKIIIILGKVWETKNKKTSKVLSFIFHIHFYLFKQISAKEYESNINWNGCEKGDNSFFHLFIPKTAFNIK